MNTNGGQKAALDLRSTVRTYFEKVEPSLARLPVAIRAFANVDGMSRFLLQTGVIESSSSLSEFAKQFCQASATSDFILLGHEDNSVDKKIKG